MTPTFDLLLNTMLLMSIVIYAFVVYSCETRYKFSAKGFDSNSNELSTTEYSNIENKLSKPKFIGNLNAKENLKISENSKIELKLKKYNRQLKRSLHTLTYITMMEANGLENENRLKDLLNLKHNVKQEIIRLTKQINYYKSQLEDSIAA